jgi:hypothetical protein
MPKLTLEQWTARVLVLAAVTVVSLLALPFLPPVPQDQAYHLFADQRTCLGIANFWNVVSNLPFLLIGAAGLRLPGPLSIRMIFLGVFLVGFGSPYYHWAPSDGTLIWDRLPMTLGFMAILATIIGERVSERAGALMLWPLLAVGAISLVVYGVTGDLRLYGWVVFFPIAALLLIFCLFPARYTGTGMWLTAAALYAVAKAFEFFDAPVFAAGQLISGHTLKHLFAAAGCFVLLRNFQTRRPIPA